MPFCMGLETFLIFLFAFSKGLYYSMHALNSKFGYENIFSLHFLVLILYRMRHQTYTAAEKYKLDTIAFSKR